ncbi:proline--tRNA ligase [Paenibacillus sp. JX-17]|uniref:Proline--tRNA ligase n=1 Tax=Paenibacillus lacisoli TaxID=3064525 RepID=A0ABT9CD25_9BACL|nr:proline--tRNA ligase [Paenibacillus sp. JX-17]MDO7907170.1 proline--tRNA ligase [Paenibacillus sp. JX-17]
MRQSQLLSTTLREAPAEAETASHRLLLRAGYIRQLAAGIYSYLPLARRVLHKIERIVREEMEHAGAQEVLLPSLQPADLWEKSGRYERYGPELMRLQDRHRRPFVLGPTHEEVITALVDGEVSSYRRLPVTVYQIGTKFRDERRPRSGLLRGREFMMKDAYSFAAGWTELDDAYQAMFSAYHRIFERCGLRFAAVEADAGSIGGEGGTHEFMALAESGEDWIVSAPASGYAANLEKAYTRRADSVLDTSTEALEGSPRDWSADLPFTRLDTPGIKSIDELTAFLKVPASRIVKTLIYKAGQQVAAVLVRGDDEVNELKAAALLGVDEIEMIDAAQAESLGLAVGFIGPVGLKLTVLADPSVMDMGSAITGANEMDMHLSGVVPGRDFEPDLIADVRLAKEGDLDPQSGEPVVFTRGIEIGHVFKLGTKYSEALGAMYLDQNGQQKPFIMGCYGIGVSRLLSAIVEQRHDEQGIIWPEGLAPYDVHLIPVSVKDESQMAAAEELEQILQKLGFDVLMDDRDERAGVKFKDADLIGCPVRLVVGKGAAERIVEWKERAAEGKEELTFEEAIQRLKSRRR